MRKIVSILIILAFVFSGIMAYAGIPTLSETGEIRGQGKYPFEPHRTFRLVRYSPLASGTTEHKYHPTLPVNHLDRWATGARSGDGVTVTGSYVSNDNRIAGVNVSALLTPDPGNYSNSATQDVGERNWGWLQTYGKAEVRINTTNQVAVKAAMGTSAVAGEADQFVASTTDATKNGNAGFFYDAGAAAADNVECFLRLD